MITLGLSFRLGHFNVFIIPKIVSNFKISASLSECDIPHIPSWIPWDMNTRKVLSEVLCSGRTANSFTALVISCKKADQRFSMNYHYTVGFHLKQSTGFLNNSMKIVTWKRNFLILNFMKIEL